MEEPLTDKLLDELLSSPDPKSYLEKHRLQERTLSDYLQQLLAEKKLAQAQVVREAGLNPTYGYQIFTGERSNPGRDKVLAIAFAMNLPLMQTNRTLQAAGANELYCKNRRDVIIIFAIDHEYSLQQTNELLYEFGEGTIG